MLKPRFRLVRTYDEPFSQFRLIDDAVARLKTQLGEVGRIIDDHLGFGFRVEFGRPKTLKELIYPTAVSNKEQLSKLKDMINDVQL